MATQLVKKNFGGKRTGYKGKGSSAWDKAKYWTYGTGGTIGSILYGLAKYGLAGKDGGRVTKRGIGKAKRGYGKVMGKK